MLFWKICGIYSRAAFINVSALKCGVSSRAALNRKNTVFFSLKNSRMWSKLWFLFDWGQRDWWMDLLFLDPSVMKYLVSLWLVSHLVVSSGWFNLSFIIRMYLKAYFQPWCNAAVCFCFEPPLLYDFEFRSYLGLSCCDGFSSYESLV